MEPLDADARRTAVHTPTPTARAALCLIAAALLVTGCTSHKLPQLVIATPPGNPENDTGFSGVSGGGYDLAGRFPDQPTHARVYVWPSTKPSQSDVVKLASVFGLSGTPTRHAHGWDLKSASGELRMRDDQGWLWHYDAAAANQSRCDAANFDIDELPGDAPHYMCATDPPAVAPASTLTVASLLTALGVSGDEQSFADQLRSYVTISPKVAGLPTQGIDLTIGVDAHGVATATGHSTPTDGHEYPLRTAKAVFHSLGTVPPIASAYLRLTLQDNATSAGATILVPTWVFLLEDGSVGATAVAVDPAYIRAPPGPSIVVTGGGASRAPKPASS